MYTDHHYPDLKQWQTRSKERGSTISEIKAFDKFLCLPFYLGAIYIACKDIIFSEIMESYHTDALLMRPGEILKILENKVFCIHIFPLFFLIQMISS